MSQNIETFHKVYLRNRRRWTMNKDFYRGGESVLNPEEFFEKSEFTFPIDGYTGNVEATPDNVEAAFRTVTMSSKSYLFSHQREKPTHYLQRQMRAVHIPVMQPIYDEYISGVLKNPIKRDGIVSLDAMSDPLRSYAVDVDLAGTDINSFTKSILTIAAHSGRCHALTLPPSASDGASSALHEVYEGKRPYSTIVTPLDFIDWATDSNGKLLWAKIYFTIPPGENWQGSSDTDVGIMVVTRSELIKFARSSKNSSDWIETERHTHGFGFVPISSCYMKRSYSSRFNMDCDPFCPSLVDIDRSIYNKLSLLDQIDYSQTFAVLAVPGKYNSPLNVGIFDAITFDSSGARPGFISPDAEIAAGLWVRIKQQFDLARRVSNLSRGISEVSKEARSGDALNLESEGKHSVMIMLAEAGERFENELLAHVSDMFNMKKQPVSSFSREFDIMAMESKIDNIINLQKAKVPYESLKPAIKHVIVDMLKKMGSSDSEIEEASESIENDEPESAQLQLPGMQQEESGDDEIPG